MTGIAWLSFFTSTGIPGGAAAKGLGKQERTAQGKATSVIGQIYIAALVTPGGDGKSIRDLFGGQMPPHIVVDVSLGSFGVTIFSPLCL